MEECEVCSKSAVFQFTTKYGDIIYVCGEECALIFMNREWFYTGTLQVNAILTSAINDRTVMIKDLNGKEYRVDIIAAYFDPESAIEKQIRLNLLRTIIGENEDVAAHLVIRSLEKKDTIIGELKLFTGGKYDQKTKSMVDAKEIWDLETVLEIGVAAMQASKIAPESMKNPEQIESTQIEGRKSTLIEGKSNKWIQGAIVKHPGSLRRAAMKRGLLRNKYDKLSKSDLDALESDARRMKGAAGRKLEREVVMARTLMKIHK